LNRLEPATITTKNRIGRLLWNFVWLVFYRPSPNVMHAWRCLLLRLFGAKIGRKANPYPSAKVWAPWNLEMGDDSTLANGVDCYCVAKVTLGANATISQYSHLCTASHDYTNPAMPLMVAPIVIGEQAWITADVFVGPGVTIGDGAVITARSSVFTDIDSWVVARGSPAVAIRQRVMKDGPKEGRR
jgi:putative colanic acid biosynthesis acetyltransferase WcaF